jgi:hypothetical protein
MNKNLALARKLAREGLVIIPLLAGDKKPAVRWKRFQTERPTDAELVEWFSEKNYVPAIVTGELSGITVIDCDNREAAEAWAAGSSSSTIRQTTKRGMHFVYRWAGERNTVRVDGMPGVDRRGEGGYVAAYPESVHWTRERLEAAPTLDDPRTAEKGFIRGYEGGCKAGCEKYPSSSPLGQADPRTEKDGFIRGSDAEDGYDHSPDFFPLDEVELDSLSIAMPGEDAVWDDDRDCWRIDYLDAGQPCSMWLDSRTHELVEA